MKNFLFLLTLGIASFLFACTGRSYPEQMTAQERKQYYADYNNTRTQKEWDSIGKATQAQLKTAAKPEGIQQSAEQNTTRSIAFRIKNNSIFFRKVKIADNVLDFKPFELRYVGFKPGTSAYLHQSKKDTYLFTVAAADQGKTFNISK